MSSIISLKEAKVFRDGVRDFLIEREFKDLPEFNLLRASCDLDTNFGPLQLRVDDNEASRVFSVFMRINGRRGERPEGFNNVLWNGFSGKFNFHERKDAHARNGASATIALNRFKAYFPDTIKPL